MYICIIQSNLKMGHTFQCCIQAKTDEIFQFEMKNLLDPSLKFQIKQMKKQFEQDSSSRKKIRYPNKMFFEGKLDSQNNKNGYGELCLAGHAFYGEFKDNKPHGHGIMISDNQEYYIGSFLNGKLHGRGKEYLKNSTFEGQYQHDQRTSGILKNQFYQYSGSFKDNKFDGEGKILFNNGNCYEGQFSKGKYSGDGLFIYGDGSIYKGSFKEGKYDGEGQYTWPNGDSYTGSYVKGMRMNKGVLIVNSVKYMVDSNESINNEQKNRVYTEQTKMGSDISNGPYQKANFKKKQDFTNLF